MVEKLRRIAESTNTGEYIFGKGDNDQEKANDRKAKFKLIKFFYLATKGGRAKEAISKKTEANRMLDEFISQHPPGEHGHHLVAGPSVIYAENKYQSRKIKEHSFRQCSTKNLWKGKCRGMCCCPTSDIIRVSVSPIAIQSKKLSQ